MSLSAASLEFYSKGQWDSLQPSSEGRLPLCQTHHLSHVLLDMYSTCFYIQQCQLSLLTSAIAAQITRLIILMLHLKRQLFSLDQQPTCRNGDPSLFAVKSQDFPWPSVEKKTKQILSSEGSGLTTPSRMLRKLGVTLEPVLTCNFWTVLQQLHSTRVTLLSGCFA